MPQFVTLTLPRYLPDDVDLGEFFVLVDVDCDQCDGSMPYCRRCGGSGKMNDDVEIDIDTIRDIYSAAVCHFIKVQGVA